MHYDFVDIGTCNFDTSFEHTPDAQNYSFLFVDPLDFYLNHYNKHSNIKTDCVAISNRVGTCKVYFVPEEDCHDFNLPWYVKGCNSIDKMHPTVVKVLKELELDLIKSKEVDVITFDMLCDKHDVTSITNLKIDTEGHEEFIMPDVLKRIKSGLLTVKTIKFENQEVLGNKKFLDNLLPSFYEIGYSLVQTTDMDVVIQK